MPDLTKEQIAEGRRLLEEYQRCFGFVGKAPTAARYAWRAWVDDHAASLLSAAEAKASAAEFAGAAHDIDSALTPYLRSLTQFVDSPSANADEAFVLACERLESARKRFRELAAQRGIELPKGDAS